MQKYLKLKPWILTSAKIKGHIFFWLIIDIYRLRYPQAFQALNKVFFFSVVDPSEEPTCVVLKLIETILSLTLSVSCLIH